MNMLVANVGFDTTKNGPSIVLSASTSIPGHNDSHVQDFRRSMESPFRFAAS